MDRCEICAYWDSDEHNKGCSHPFRLMFPGRYDVNADSCDGYRAKTLTEEDIVEHLEKIRSPGAFYQTALKMVSVPYKYVYLAGHVSGLTHVDATAWRDRATEELLPRIQCLSPLRGLEYLERKDVIQPTYPGDPMFTPRGIITRDYCDLRRADLLLAYLMHAPNKASIGTIDEIARASELKKPIVVVMGTKNVHQHPMIQEAAGYIVDNLDDAIEIVRGVLLP